MGLKSRRKGRTGERQAVLALRELGFPDARRTAQRTGRTGMADVEGIDGLHLEVKVGAAPPIQAGMAQAVRDGADRPVVLSRKDREEWLMTFRLKDLWEVVELLRAGCPQEETE